MYYEDSKDYVEVAEKYPLVQRYSVTMSFNDINDGIKIDGTVEFEIEVEVPRSIKRYPEDMAAVAEKKAFSTIESHAEYGRGILPNLHIDTMDKGFVGYLNQDDRDDNQDNPTFVNRPA